MLLETSSAVALRRRLHGESVAFERVDATWDYDEEDGCGDFPCGSGPAPVFSARACDAFRTELLTAGELVPINVISPGPSDYFLLVVSAMVDCLDAARSSKPKRLSGEMEKVVFRGDKLDLGLPAFRVPQSPQLVFWNAPFVERFLAFGPQAVTAWVVWSEDPALKPGIRPMR